MDRALLVLFWSISLSGCAGSFACLEGADGDGDGLVLVAYVPGLASSPHADLDGFLNDAYGLDRSCAVVGARQERDGACVEQPVLVYCPEVGEGRNIGNAVVYLATHARPVNVHRGDSPYAPAQLNVDICGLQAVPDEACESGPVFVDLFCHHGTSVTLLDEDGAPAPRTVGDSAELLASCEGATWHHDDELGLEALPMREQRSLSVSATETTTLVAIHGTLVLDSDQELYLGNNRRPFGALELTGPGYEQACFADGADSAVAPVPSEGDDGLFFLAEGKLEIEPPMAARLHLGSDGAADVALCLHSLEQRLDGEIEAVTVTSYGYVEPVAHPERAGISHQLAPYADWQTWPAAQRSWTIAGQLAAGPPEASWEQLCGTPLASCAW